MNGVIVSGSYANRLFDLGGCGKFLLEIKYESGASCWGREED